MSLPSVMKSTHHFSNIPGPKINRSTFDRSHGHKTTFDCGYLIPVYVDEALPGDTINLRMSLMARLATPVFPIMDNLHMDTFFFAVPNRLLWENWEKFNGAQDDPGDSIDYTIPQMQSFNGAAQQLFDYLGIPPGVTMDANNSISALPARAYNLIWNEWFRDQNLQDSYNVHTDDGPDPYSSYAIRRRGKRHDYFTSCLPWPQKGDGVPLPIGSGEIPVYGNGKTLGMWDGTTHGGMYRDITGTSILYSDTTLYNVNVGTSKGSGNPFNSNIGLGVTVATSGESGLVADISDQLAPTINQLRESFMIQEILERDARGGTRYTEIIRAHFGVISPDFRLQRPEYLGGSSTPINVNPIAQTSESGTTDLGTLAATVQVAASGHGFMKSFTEHCTLIGLAMVRADVTYQEGIERMFKRKTRYDFYLPALAHLGEQAVLNEEIYFQGTSADEDVFGYQERWAEYRYKPSRISGVFRSEAANSLDSWHLSQHFNSLPSLNSTFIKDATYGVVDRAVATSLSSQVIFDSWFDIKHARPMPVYSTPAQFGRF